MLLGVREVTGVCGEDEGSWRRRFQSAFTTGATYCTV